MTASVDRLTSALAGRYTIERESLVLVENWLEEVQARVRASTGASR